MLLAAVLFAIHIDCCQEPPDPVEVQAVTAQIEKSAADLRRYKESRSFGDLSSAAADMDGTLSYGALTRDNFIRYRRTLVSRYAYIISQLQTFYDTSYDPYDMRNFAVVYSGPEPERNTPMWNELQEEEKDNVVKRARYSRYRQIYDVERRAITSLKLTLLWFCDLAPQGISPDIPALNAILDQNHITGDRRIEIISNFCMRPGPEE